jgi:TRAP-type transport system periplasmic protein
MKKAVLVLCLLAMLMPAFAGAAQEVSEKTYTIRLGHVVATSHVEHKASVLFKEIVERESGGRITVEIYPTNQTGDQSEQIEALRIGTQEMLMGGVAVIANYYPKMYMLEIPYLFTSNDMYLEYIDSASGQDMLEEMITKANVRALGFAPREPRQTTTKKPIYSIEDVAGLKIRVPAAASLVAFWNAVGAAPVTLAFNELYQALATNVVEAQENPIDMIANSQFYEVQDYVIMTNHTLNMSILLIAEPFYQSLPKDLQEVVRDAGAQVRDFVLTTNANDTATYIEFLKEQGMEFIDVDENEYREASKNLYKDFIARGYFTEEDYQQLLNFVETF